ncbi:MAG: UbiA family prenyltransferase [Desulfobacterales bacterium]|nr:MAG: UbiA family prenyltransferase [Desulfobacterales bacterium]
MCTAALGALLWLGHFPSLTVVGLGLITVFAGYTAVYAFNDVVGYRSDKRKLQAGARRPAGDCPDIDAVFVRHPMAQGFLSFREGLVWSLAWALLALIGAYLLNPWCVLVFIAGCLLEAVYCLMWKISPLRTLVSGVVKTAGAIAAVVAVDPNPSFAFLLVLFLMLFFWEIGGQNVPNDWVDLEEDKRFHAQTVPIRLGMNWARGIILGSVLLAMVFNLILLPLSQISFARPHVLAFLGVGLYFLLWPALRLYKTKESTDAMALFNKASYFPLALLTVVVIELLI